MKSRILVVDDNENSRIILVEKMRLDGYEVDIAKDGVEALKKVGEFHPDLVLLDVMMPQMDGFETCRRLKSSEDTRYIPVIMLTARSELEDKVMGLEVGAEDYIVKPYSLMEVTARVQSLLRMRVLQAKLRESEKMAALGEMVDGIAHELRNPLVTAGGMARRLYEHETDLKHKEYAKNIMNSVIRIEKMMQRIDEYKEILVAHFKEGDINEVIKEAVRDAEVYKEDKRIAIKTELLPEPPRFSMDSGHLKTAIFNILQNSIEAINDDAGEINVGLRFEGDDKLLLSISDNGSGIDEKFARNIFNPFHTSKMTGAGLGLTITYKIIQDHNGTIDVTSKKGEGTTFKISFVLSPEAVVS